MVMYQSRRITGLLMLIAAIWVFQGMTTLYMSNMDKVLVHINEYRTL